MPPEQRPRSSAREGEPLPGRGSRTRRVVNAAVLFIPIGILGNVILTLVATDRALLAAVATLPVGFLLLAVVLAVLPWFTSAARFLIWGRFLGYDLRARDALRAALAAEVGAALTPTAIGGDLFRFGALVERGLPPGAAATVTLVPKLEDAVVFGLAIPFAVVYTRAWELPVLRWATLEMIDDAGLAAATAALIGLASWLVVRLALRGFLGRWMRRRGRRRYASLRRRLRGAWHDARSAFAVVAQRGRTRFAATVALAAIHWTAKYSVVIALAAFLGIPHDPVLFWLLQFVVFMVMYLVPTPGAAGGAEAAFSILYAPLLPPGSLGLVTAGWRFLTFYLQVGLAAAVIGFTNRRR
jgi:glycosyltransferase 2 family protein